VLELQFFFFKMAAKIAANNLIIINILIIGAYNSTIYNTILLKFKLYA